MKRYLPGVIAGLLLTALSVHANRFSGGGGLTSGTTTITGGADTQVCFNDGGTLSCGDAGLTFTKATAAFTAGETTLNNGTDATAPLTVQDNGTAIFTVADVSGTAAMGVTVTGGATGTRPTIAATGTDANRGIILSSKGDADVVLRDNARDLTWDGASFVGNADDADDLGSNGNKWSFIYLLNGIIIGADPADAGNIRLPNAGTIQFEASPTGTDVVALSVNTSEQIELGTGGTGIVATGTFTSSAAADLGWSVVSVANQACNTTCTNACVVGFDLVAGLLGCGSALSDQCLCAGGS